MSSADRKPCPVCGELIAAQAKKCRFCGEDLDSASDQAEGDATGGVIPYKNVPALIAYYCGVFSIIPCFVLGWVAFVMGIIGLRKANREPHVKGKVHAWIGIIAGLLFGLIYTGLTVLGVVGAIVGSQTQQRF